MFGDLKITHTVASWLHLISSSEKVFVRTGARDSVFPLDDHVRRCGVGRKRRKINTPFSCRVRRGVGSLAGERHRDFFSGIGSAPDGNQFVALQNSIVIEHVGGNDIGANGRTEICGTKSNDSKAKQVFR